MSYFFISLSILNKNAASGIPRSLSFISQGYIEFILNKTFLLAVRAITFTLLHGSPLWISCLRMSVPPPPSPLASLLSTNVFSLWCWRWDIWMTRDNFAWSGSISFPVPPCQQPDRAQLMPHSLVNIISVSGMVVSSSLMIKFGLF